MMYQYNAAGLQSGAIQSDATAWELTRDYFLNLTPQSVMFLHLWFIYYLCWTYMIVVGARGLVALIDFKGKLRSWMSIRAGFLMANPLGVFVLAALFAKYTQHNGYSTWNYLQLTNEDLAYDHELERPAYTPLRAALLDSPQDSIPEAVWSLLPEANREFVRQNDEVSDNQLSRLWVTINGSVLGATEFTQKIDLNAIELSAPSSKAAKRSEDDRSVAETQLINREFFQEQVADQLLNRSDLLGKFGI